jgi:hypothetical protein
MSVLAAVVAGLSGAGVTAMAAYIALALAPTHAPVDVFYLMGSVFTRERGHALVLGAALYLCAGVALAIGHALLYQWFGLRTELVLWGLMSGFVQWLVLGAAAGAMRDGGMRQPGIFFGNMPGVTVVGFMALHLLYGVVVGAVYEVVG